ncbi:MAG: hypothetical protein JWQ20_465, partial [Conexibacter sp.]|nr:hypothetical protein [Conexibacter sp.]
MTRSTKSLMVAAALMLATSGAAAAGTPPRVDATRISLDREGVDGALEAVRGSVTIETPTTMQRDSHDGALTARFTSHVSGACTARVQVSNRAVATRSGAAAQAAASTGFRTSALGQGRRRDGAWALVEQEVLDPQLRQPTGAQQLYGIAVVRLARHRWLHVRAFVTYAGTCSADDRQKGSAAVGVRDLLVTARVQAR